MTFPCHDTLLGEFIKFDPVTLVPYETKLIDFTLMNPSQIEWYNHYSGLILTNVMPRLHMIDDADTIKWILARTKPVNPWIGSKNEL